MNLFEQQAQALRAARPEAVRAEPLRQVSALEMMGFVERASLKQCANVARALSARLTTLEKSRAGMQAANIGEAAQFAADAALDIEGALAAGPEKPCECGRCDDCCATRADEHYGRRRDGALTG